VTSSDVDADARTLFYGRLLLLNTVTLRRHSLDGTSRHELS